MAYNPEYQRKYHQKHKEERNARSREYHQKHKKEHNACNREYYQEHKEELTARHKKWSQDHKEQCNSRSKGYYKEHKEKRKTAIKKWIKNHPEKFRELIRRRRVSKLNAPGSHTAEQILFLRNISGGFCPGHNRPPHQVGPDNLTADHIIPLSKGGSDYIDNIRMMCRPCNSSKGTEIIERATTEDPEIMPVS